ncbi:hypothetical protein RZS08_21610, partial [Arthrospira platensis SPKY1]|nr:hypothetical protein [Arthrospira platensis SPKY1]
GQPSGGEAIFQVAEQSQVLVPRGVPPRRTGPARHAIGGLRPVQAGARAHDQPRGVRGRPTVA